jgi:hypothetical protein
VLIWNGNLTAESESILQVEIGDLTAGTQHDRIDLASKMRKTGWAFVEGGLEADTRMRGFGLKWLILRDLK